MTLLRIFKRENLSDTELHHLMERESAVDQRAFELVQEIIQDVETRKEQAVLDLTERFDGARLNDLLATKEEFDQAEKLLSPELKMAFSKAADNIRKFHELQLQSLKPGTIQIEGTDLGFHYVPVDSASVYVPGGKASYPSSVLMGVLPAKIAGVPRIQIVSPPAADGSISPAVLYAAKLAGTDRIIKAGGAQGIAAAAFGLAGGVRGGVIVGPGNRFVTAAKTLFNARGLIRMDMPAGPSEVVVIADSSANPRYIASDMLSQAEHGDDSPAILVTDSMELAEATARELEKGIQERPARAEMKTTSIREHSFAVVFQTMEECFQFSNDYAPEHLEICTENPQEDLKKITSAGSIFLGHYAPVALGDYYSGTNHVLPTGGAGRYYSGLGVDTFMKKLTWQHPTRESLKEAMPHIMLMSESEGFDQEHGHSVSVRFDK